MPIQSLESMQIIIGGKQNDLSIQTQQGIQLKLTNTLSILNPVFLKKNYYSNNKKRTKYWNTNKKCYKNVCIINYIHIYFMKKISILFPVVQFLLQVYSRYLFRFFLLESLKRQTILMLIIKNLHIILSYLQIK